VKADLLWRRRLDHRIESEGTEILLTSGSLEDENSIEQPRKVAPVTRRASGLAPEFTRTFAPRSLTILRLKTVKASAAVRP
jgi:alpha-L-arabinofuranosidase